MINEKVAGDGPFTERNVHSRSKQQMRENLFFDEGLFTKSINQTRLMVI